MSVTPSRRVIRLLLVFPFIVAAIVSLSPRARADTTKIFGDYLTISIGDWDKLSIARRRDFLPATVVATNSNACWMRGLSLNAAEQGSSRLFKGVASAINDCAD